MTTKLAHIPARGERRPDEAPTEHARRLAEAVDRANRVASAVRERRLRGSQGDAGPDAHRLPARPWSAPCGRANGGLPSRWATPPPSTTPRPLDVVWITGVYPAAMTRKSEINLEEL